MILYKDMSLVLCRSAIDGDSRALIEIGEIFESRNELPVTPSVSAVLSVVVVLAVAAELTVSCWYYHSQTTSQLDFVYCKSELA